MAPFPSALIVVRAPRRGAVVLLPLLIAAVGIGCSSRRASMRPVYITPAPPPATVVPVVPAAPPTAVPSDVDSIPSGAEVTVPTPPKGDRDAGPPLTRPNVPSAEPGEPFLTPTDPDASRVPPPRGNNGNTTKPGTSGTGTGNAPPPSARLDGGGRFAAKPARGTATPTSLTLRARVQPYVKDIDDLFTPPKADRPWKYIVLHHSAGESGGYDSIDREHRKRLGFDGCGYHFVIGNGTESPDGAIEISQRWRDQKLGVHCRDGKNPDVNEYGIGICLVGDFEKSEPTPRQIAAAKALVTYLEARYKIPAEHTETHAHLAASPTSCPGRYFPSKAILGNSGLAVR